MTIRNLLNDLILSVEFGIILFHVFEDFLALVLHVVITNHLHIIGFVKFENKRRCIWNDELGDLLIVEIRKVLNKSTEDMLVRGEEDRLATFHVFQSRVDLLLPVLLDSLTDHLEALAARHLLMLFLWKVLVEFVKSGVLLRLILDKRWRVIERLPPLAYLFLAELVLRLFLTLALQKSIVALIEAPVLHNFGLAIEAHLLENDVRGVDSSIED